MPGGRGIGRQVPQMTCAPKALATSRASTFGYVFPVCLTRGEVLPTGVPFACFGGFSPQFEQTSGSVKCTLIQMNDAPANGLACLVFFRHQLQYRVLSLDPFTSCGLPINLHPIRLQENSFSISSGFNDLGKEIIVVNWP